MMHQVVLARSPLADLLSVLGGLCAPLKELPAGQETIDWRRDGDPILAGEADGLSYLFENYGTVFATCWGLLARAARQLDTLVVGSTYDPSEDHCELFVARGGDVVRAFWSNPRRATRPFAKGAPLACEAECPLSAPGGAGLTAAVRSFGFSLLDSAGDALLPGEHWMLWKGDALSLLERDELAAWVGDHVRTFANPATSSARGPPAAPSARSSCTR